MIVYSVKDVRNGSRSASIRALAVASRKTAAARRMAKRSAASGHQTARLKA